MRDPLRRLKTLPWVTLIQTALLTVLLATLLDLALLFGLQNLAQIWPQASGAILGGGLGALLLQLLVAGGVGALAVILLERVFRDVIPGVSTLWALVLCLAVALYIKTLLPVPMFLVGFSYLQFVGMVFGLFSQGRGYWR